MEKLLSDEDISLAVECIMSVTGCDRATGFDVLIDLAHNNFGVARTSVLAELLPPF